MSTRNNRSKLPLRTIMKTIREDLLRWICKKQATNNFLDRHLLRERALELTRSVGLNGFKCSETWLSHFLADHGFSNDLSNDSGPVFQNYRDWIDLMRSTIVQYKHNDLFHADELTMYSDGFPAKIVNNLDTELAANRITILMGCNSTGTTKLPLLICGPYPSKMTTGEHVYCYDVDSIIGNNMFRNWLLTVNDRMLKCNRKILLFLRRSRARALKDLLTSNVKLVYLPENFPPTLRPLRRDIFHYVKMIFRRRYAEYLMQHCSEWNIRDILDSVINAWIKIPREIVVCSFQRTHFRTDDEFLHIDCNCWESLGTGISFKKFVTFDDNLLEKNQSFNVHHGYNLRTNCKELIQIDQDNSTNEKHDELSVSSSNSENHNLYEKQIQLKLFACEENSDRWNSGEKNLHTKEQGVESKDSKDALCQKQSELCPSTSNACHTFKGQKLQRHVENIGGSLQAIIDKALTSPSRATADYARKLIDSIYASNEEARRNASNQTTSEKSNREEKTESSNSVLDKQDSISLPSTSATDRIDISRNTDQDKGKNERSTSKLRKKNDSLSDTEILKVFGKKRQRFNDTDDDDEPATKTLVTDTYWAKQFETTFVFGLSSTSDSADHFSRVQRDENSNSCRSSERLQKKKSKSRNTKKATFSMNPAVSPRD